MDKDDKIFIAVAVLIIVGLVAFFTVYTEISYNRLIEEMSEM